MKVEVLLGALLILYATTKIGCTIFAISSNKKFIDLKNEYNKMAEDRGKYRLQEYGTDEVAFMKKQDKLIRMLQKAHLDVQRDYMAEVQKYRNIGISELDCKKLDDRREVIERALSQVESGQPLTEDIVLWQTLSLGKAGSS